MSPVAGAGAVAPVASVWKLKDGWKSKSEFGVGDLKSEISDPESQAAGLLLLERRRPEEHADHPLVVLGVVGFLQRLPRPVADVVADEVADHRHEPRVRFGR